MVTSEQWVCCAPGCDYHHEREYEVKEHQKTHLRGKETPRERRTTVHRAACKCKLCKPVRSGGSAVPAPCSGDMAPRAASTSKKESIVATDLDRIQLIARLQAELAALNAKFQALEEWIPAHRFLSEPLPSKKSTYFKVIDVLNGNVAGHLVWTHVHSCGNVRFRGRKGYVQVYSAHGWTDWPTDKAARAALDALPERLAMMWLKLEERQRDALMSAVRKFAETNQVCMDKETFGVASTPMIAATNVLVTEIATQFEEYGDMGRE